MIFYKTMMSKSSFFFTVNLRKLTSLSSCAPSFYSHFFPSTVKEENDIFYELATWLIMAVQ